MRGAAEPMPGRYAVELAVIDETGWSWEQVQRAPADLIEELLERRGARMHWEAERARMDEEKARQRDGRRR